MQQVSIREVTSKDFDQITAIYNHYVQHTLITFDIEPYTLPQLAEKILSLQKDYPVLVAHDEDTILGYA